MTTSNNLSRHHGMLARIKSALSGLARDRLGATTVEYFVLVAFLALGGIAAIKGIQTAVAGTASGIATGVTNLQEFKAAAPAK